jgi:CHAD domain-containing protein
MSASPVRFQLDSRSKPEDLESSLRGRFQVKLGKPEVEVRVHYDTFDSRLFRAGRALSVATASDGSARLRLATLGGDVLHVQPSRREPGFAWDLPDGALRDEVEDLISMRRVLPVASVRCEARPLRVLDKEHKTVVRLWHERRQASLPDDAQRPRPLPAVVVIANVKGYDKAFRSVTAFFSEDEGLPRTTQGSLGAALVALDRLPGDNLAKLRVPLEPDLRADQAMKRIYSRLRRAMLANVDGTKQQLDTEFLHDLRVAVRRTRAALSQVRGVFPDRVVLKYKREFRWLGAVTGPARDLDVFLLKFDTITEDVADADRPLLEPLRPFLAEQRARVQVDLVAALSSRRFGALLADWGKFLDAPVPARSSLPAASTQVIEVASARIWKRFRRILKEGRRIHGGTPAAALHEVRLDCKKLRYMMEMFRPLYPARDITLLIKALKRLQDNLGDFNDYEVQQGEVSSLAEQLHETGAASVPMLMAMGRLGATLRDGQDRERRAFHERFGEFAGQSTQQRFRTLFAPPDAGRKLL